MTMYVSVSVYVSVTVSIDVKTHDAGTTAESHGLVEMELDAVVVDLPRPVLRVLCSLPNPARRMNNI